MKNILKTLLLTAAIITLHSCTKDDDPRDADPVGVLINKIVVTSFPETDEYNYEWDTDGSRADLYIAVDDYDNEWVSSVHNNALSTTPHVFIPSSPVLMLGNFSITAYDYDQGNSYDEQIGYVSNYGTDYLVTRPDSILLQDYYGGVSCVVYVDYVYSGK